MPNKDEGGKAEEFEHVEQADRTGDALTGLSKEERERHGGAGGVADEEEHIERGQE